MPSYATDIRGFFSYFVQRVQHYTDRIKPEKRFRESDVLPSSRISKKARFYQSDGEINATNGKSLATINLKDNCQDDIGIDGSDTSSEDCNPETVLRQPACDRINQPIKPIGKGKEKKAVADVLQICNLDDDLTHHASKVKNSTANGVKKVDHGSFSNEAGLLQQIQLINFMCHKNLKITFGKNVNFIIGNNGSGKSAIMVGIIVGLGGRSRLTNRATSMKGLIKKGSSYARIIITLANDGSDSYYPEKFGSKIIIQRDLWQDGHANYKIKSSKGFIVAEEKKELMAILDHFDIQVDNPVCFLTQDASKEFLSSHHPSKMYQFYLKGTQLSQLINNCNYAKLSQRILQDILNKEEESLKELQDDLEQKMERQKLFDQIDEINQQLTQLKSELAWAYVYQEENKLKQIEFQAQQVYSRRAEIEEELIEIEKYTQDCQRDKEALERELNRLIDRLSHLQLCKEDFLKEHNCAKGDECNLKQKYESIKCNVDHLKNTYYGLETKFNEINQKRLLGQAGKQFALLEKELSGQKSALSSYAQRKLQLSEEIKAEKDQLNQLQLDIAMQQQELNDLEKETGRLKASRWNRLTIYGSYMPELIRHLHEMKQRGQFHRNPYGPLGYHIATRDPKWNLAIERCLGRALTSFLCHNFHDAKLLKEVCRKMKIAKYPTVIVCRYQDKPYDIPTTEGQGLYKTVLDMLIAENCNITNCLIDQKQIERTLLIESSQEARAFMCQQQAHQLQAYTLTGDSIEVGKNHRCYSNTRPHIDYLIEDVQQEINKRRERTEKINQIITKSQFQFQFTTNVISVQKEELASICDAMLACQDKTQELQNEIEDIKSTEFVQEDSSELEKELQTCQEEINDEEKLLQQAYQNYQEALKTVHLLESQKKEIECEEQQVREKLYEYQNEIKHKTLQYREKLEKCKYLHKIIDELEEKKNYWLQKMNHQQEKVLTCTASACKIAADRIITEQKIEDLDHKIYRKEQSLEKLQEEIGTKEEIIAAIKEAQITYYRRKACSQILSDVFSTLQQHVHLREAKCKFIQKSLAERVTTTIGSLFSRRGLSAKLRIDPFNEEFHLQIQSLAARGGHCSHLSLSGGERSLATVALIISLLQSMSPPIICLDEFDVFMDMYNREIATSTLLNFTSHVTHRQFIFLSPQNMRQVDILIIELVLHMY
ncbi:Structural maintenance of chromosomes protein 6 [Trichoplax sp. H2]|nr:Structural maintenance of chromosomes protein 6 [Trichoplax sp. H2]|eukprot:RDD37134.1 Structural maintenance of chromosomes protein 6 [Trichoplax sp. H2]